MTRLRRGTTTYPERNFQSFRQLSRLLRGRTRLDVLNVGPGLAWRGIANRLPIAGVPRKRRFVRDVIVKYIDRIARRFVHSGKRFITFEPFELIEMLERDKNVNSLRVTVLDRNIHLGNALESSKGWDKHSRKIRVRVGDVEHVPLGKDLDLVVALNVFPYVDRSRTIRRLVNSLSADGILLCSKLSPSELKENNLVSYFVSDRNGCIYLRPAPA